jgi:hypothetical protein
VGSVFSGFSINESDTDSLPSISKAAFSEQMFNVKTILGQLVRISTTIRRSSTKYRYRKADASLKEEDFQDFKTHLIAILFISSIKGDATETQARITDYSKQLTAVQERLIHANIVRRNRIIFATRAMKSVETRAAQKSQQQPVRVIEVPTTTPETTPRLPQKPTKPISDGPAIPLQAPSIIAPSITQTATDMGSQFNWQYAVGSKSTLSIVTHVTRTGAAQDYPSCPEPISGKLLQCPYCADLLPTIYAKDQSRWRYEVELHTLQQSMS